MNGGKCPRVPTYVSYQFCSPTCSKEECERLKSGLQVTVERNVTVVTRHRTRSFNPYLANVENMVSS